MGLLLLFLLSGVSGELTHGWSPESRTSVVVSINYTHPTKGAPTQKNFRTINYLLGDSDSVSGVAFHASDNSTNVCQDFEEGFRPQEPYILLIEHGWCRTRVESRNAVIRNASAVVLYTNDQNSRFLTLEGKTNHLTFAVLSRKEGLQIASLIDNGTRVLMDISIQRRKLIEIGHLDRASVFFVTMIFAVVMITSLVWLLFFYIQRFRYVYGKEVLSKKLCSAAKKALDKIPIKTVKNGDSDYEEDSECCAICIESFQYGELIRTLPCDHTFHKICIDPWLLEQRSCPMCKMDILRHFGLIYTGSQESVLEMFDQESINSRSESPPDQEVIVIPNQRRRSSVTLAVSRKDDRRSSAVVIDVANVQSSSIEISTDDDSEEEITWEPPAMSTLARRKSQMSSCSQDRVGMVD